MRTKPAVPAHRKSQRGIALAMFGILLLMFTAFAVVGVDVGRLAFTASEVQSMADAAALAAVGDHLGGDGVAGTVDPTAHTADIVADNTIDGRDGTISSGTTAGITSLTPGTYDFTTKTFTESPWTDPLTNAAMAVGSGTVSNLVAAAIGVASSTVTRRAIAAAGPICDTVAAFPVALEESKVSSFINSPDCNNLAPTLLFQVPGQNSCFTSLSPSPANVSNAAALVPSQCCKNKSVCGGGDTVNLAVGDTINLVNGQLDALLQIMQGCLDDPDGAGPLQPIRDFVVPVIPTGKCSTGGVVQYFATIHIDHVVTTGSTKGIYVTAICKDNITGSDPGCVHGGGGNGIALVE